ncbi:GD16677 [Drosophila simulans]|uniref:GD16677 n=1 Tax=Drosophila simulans TaxID=7240 RepID=B4R4F8_DROSI|nr:GD16677 [Drosophila simulans]
MKSDINWGNGWIPQTDQKTRDMVDKDETDKWGAGAGAEAGIRMAESVSCSFNVADCWWKMASNGGTLDGSMAKGWVD